MVSVVVPVYNVEQYVSRCVESLISQTYKDIEIILVDDGSEDQSGVICDQYGKRDQRIVAIHKKNGGLSDARNEGVRHARGKWIVFVDGDDFVHPDYIRILHRNITANDADISVCRYAQTKDGVVKKEIQETTELYEKVVGLEKLLYQYISTSVCDKMYKRELFQGIFFPYGKLYEDVLAIFQIFRRANRIVVSNCYLYYYYLRDDSIIHKKFTEKKLDYIDNTKCILEQVRKEYPMLEKAALSRVLWADVHIVVQIGKDKKYSRLQSEIWEEIKRYRMIVLTDRKCRWQNRVVLLLSFLGKNAMCGIYSFSKT